MSVIPAGEIERTDFVFGFHRFRFRHVVRLGQIQGRQDGNRDFHRNDLEFSFPRSCQIQGDRSLDRFGNLDRKQHPTSFPDFEGFNRFLVFRCNQRNALGQFHAVERQCWSVLASVVDQIQEERGFVSGADDGVFNSAEHDVDIRRTLRSAINRNRSERGSGFRFRVGQYAQFELMNSVLSSTCCSPD